MNNKTGVVSIERHYTEPDGDGESDDTGWFCWVRYFEDGDLESRIAGADHVIRRKKDAIALAKSEDHVHHQLYTQ